MAAQVGCDFVGRSVLLFRNEFAGRGMSNGAWMSPLPARDLLVVMSDVLGPPANMWHQPALGAHFVLGGGGSNAALSIALGLASAAVFGVGWIATAQRQLTSANVHFRDDRGFGGFLITEPNNRPAGQLAPKLVSTVLRAMQAHESSVFAARCLRGWNPAPEELAQLSDETVHAELAAMAG